MILEDFAEGKWLRPLTVVGFIAILLLLAFQVLQPFIVPVIWAAILAYVTWPMHERLVRLCSGRRALAALVMTFLLSAAIILPIFWFALLIKAEALPFYREIVPLLATLKVPEFIADIPLLGPRIQEILAQVARDPDQPWAEGAERGLARPIRGRHRRKPGANRSAKTPRARAGRGVRQKRPLRIRHRKIR